MNELTEIIDIHVQYKDITNPAYIGSIIPPDDVLADTRADEDDFFDRLLEKLWDEWRQLDTQPETDHEFVVWLVVEHGWQEGPLARQSVFLSDL